MANDNKKPSVSDQITNNLREQAESSGRYTSGPRDQEIDIWIKANAQEYARIKADSELYLRREVLRRIHRQEIVMQEGEVIAAQLAASPTLRARVEDRLRNVPQERLEQARIAVTKRLLVDDVLSQTLKPQTHSIKP